MCKCEEDGFGDQAAGEEDHENVEEDGDFVVARVDIEAG
jgi:hypothetical protein